MIETEMYSLKIRDTLLIARAKNTVPSIQKLRDSFEIIKDLIQSNKVEFYLDNSLGVILNREQREFLNNELGPHIRMMAVKNSSWMAKLMVKYMKAYDSSPFQLKLVNSDEEAFRWLANRSELAAG